MATCQSCGGIIGLDCFNPEECAFIAHLETKQRETKQHNVTEVQQLKAEISALVSEFCDLYDGDLNNNAVSLLLTKLRELSGD